MVIKLSSARFGCFLFLACCLLYPRQNRAQTAAELPIMPLPAHAVQGQGQFTIDGNFGIALQGYTEPRLLRARQRFLDTLSRETGIPLWSQAQFNQPDFIIQTAGPSDPVQQLGEDESYHLEVTPAQVRLSAANPLGVLHGLQTFLQLVRTTPQGFSVPAVTIDDQPRFPWRGLMIDVSRHFIPISVIEHDLDGMEAVKLNVFHWHLSDDQGFRVESKEFPLLQEKGSNGLYYTQDQIRQVIDYARDRGIRVVPEFDMPCHTTSWFVGYPQLASGTAPYHIAIHMGVFSAAMDPTKESTYKFLDTLIGEMAELFPDQYFHIGGDECNGKEWNANPQIQSFMKAHGLATNAALQAYFTANVQKLVAKHHKIMEGWDEVLQPETPKDVVIQSWRGLASLSQTARQGNRGILSTPYYLNLDFPTSSYYLADPMGDEAAALDPEQKSRILGGEAAMWSEYVSAETINSQIWPYLAAVAERFWSPQQVRDVDSMYSRLAILSRRLEYSGLNSGADVNVMLQRMSADPDLVPLKVFAAVVGPPSGYERYRLEGVATYTTLTPLNRLVDVVPPESETARMFHNLAQDIADGKATAQQWQQARQWLTLWRDNDARLQPLLVQSELTQELVPLSHDLSRVAVIGLQALDDLENNRTVAAQDRQHNLELLKSAEQPQAVLLDRIAPSVELLVNATKTE
ncbi:MAG: beta-N-acetylhexosaminidase [Terracidiphilus sp.]